MIPQILMLKWSRYLFRDRSDSSKGGPCVLFTAGSALSCPDYWGGRCRVMGVAPVLTAMAGWVFTFFEREFCWDILGSKGWGRRQGNGLEFRRHKKLGILLKYSTENLKFTLAECGLLLILPGWMLWPPCQLVCFTKQCHKPDYRLHTWKHCSSETSAFGEFPCSPWGHQ